MSFQPKYFQFEITETVATEYSESFCKAVEDFTNAGIGLCLDDFGSGYANLNAVLRLPFDVVKMDRSLLTGITCDKTGCCFLPQYCDGYAEVWVIQLYAEGAETRRRGESAERMGRGHGPGILLLKTTSGGRVAETFHVIGNYSVIYL